MRQLDDNPNKRHFVSSQPSPSASRSGRASLAASAWPWRESLSGFAPLPVVCQTQAKLRPRCPWGSSLLWGLLSLSLREPQGQVDPAPGNRCGRIFSEPINLCLAGAKTTKISWLVTALLRRALLGLFASHDTKAAHNYQNSCSRIPSVPSCPGADPRQVSKGTRNQTGQRSFLPPTVAAKAADLERPGLDSTRATHLHRLGTEIDPPPPAQCGHNRLKSVYGGGFA